MPIVCWPLVIESTTARVLQRSIFFPEHSQFLPALAFPLQTGGLALSFEIAEAATFGELAVNVIGDRGASGYQNRDQNRGELGEHR
jgi:hypothetical protein